MAGIGVSCLGHDHPKLVAAISEQAARVKLATVIALFMHRMGQLLDVKLLQNGG
jgi:acetylornithine/succinyldiaminopimelate/putrescine aminotransferase